MGHLKQQRKNLRSTKSASTNTSTEEEDVIQEDTTKKLFVRVIEPTGKKIQ